MYMKLIYDISLNATWKRCVFKLVLKDSKDVMFLICGGNSFQSEGPACAKALSPHDFLLNGIEGKPD